MPLPRFKKLEESKKKAILAAAAREFSERGFSAASYNRIIDTAGISKGAMYYYFADKDDLYRTVLDAALAMWMEHMGTLAGAAGALDSPRGYWRECEAMYARLMRFLLEEPDSAALCWTITRARERGEAHPALTELNQHLMQWTEEIALLGQRVGAIRTDLPTDLIVHIGFALLEGMDRWLACHWDQLLPDNAGDTVAMLVGIMRRVAEPGETTKPATEENHHE